MYEKIVVSLATDHDSGEWAQVIAGPLKRDEGQGLACHDCETPGRTVSAGLSGQEGAGRLTSAHARFDQRVHSGHAIPDSVPQIGADRLGTGARIPGLRESCLAATASRIVRYAALSVHAPR